MTDRTATIADIAAAPNELARGWRVLAASSLGIGLGMSPLFMFTSGVFAVALEREFGWSRGEIMTAMVFDTIAVLFLGPLVGRFTDRIGARRIAIGSMLGIGLATIALSLISADIWTYYLLYALRSAVSVGTLPPTFAKVLNTHFDRKRGMALGIALCTTGVAGMFLPSYVQALIDGFGWRTAFVGLGLLPLVIALPAIALFLPRDGAAAQQTGAAPPAYGMSIPQALRSYRFWLLCGLAAVAGVILGGILSNLVPMLIDRGFAPAQAAAQAGLYGLTIVFGRLFSGWLLDRVWAPAVGAAFLVAPALGALLLGTGVDTVALVTLGVVLVALASGAEFDLMAFLTSRYLGLRNFSTIYAVQHGCFGMAAGLGPAIFGAVRDGTGSYAALLYASSALFLASAALMLTLGRYPDWTASPGD